jgi:beta-barrel assembly-enhancing protease
MKIQIKTFVRASLIVTLGLILSSNGCKNKTINLFSINDDIALGKQVDEEIRSKPNDYPILDSARNSVAYGHLNRITKTILNSGQVQYADKFAWRVALIHDDKVLNAFCTPGGYIYVYTGLIKFLESEDQLAGVMGHEIAHADKRHSTEAMTRQFGVQLLLDIVFGRDKGAVARVAAGLNELSYSRANETESDVASVHYLYPTDYDARGSARFFEKMLQQNSASPPEFLSTHPSPDNRVQNIVNEWSALGGKEGKVFRERYQDFIRSLPAQ